MFQEIRCIDELLPLIEGRQDFAIKRGDGYVAIDYNFVADDTFAEPLRRECRGIKFTADGQILARPYHKFFNLGEKPETQEGAIDWGSPHVVLDKLDGSMIHPVELRGEILFMTRAGVTSIAEDAGRHAAKVGLVDWCRERLREGLTPIFEWCSPRNQIVVRYPEDRLVLTGVRETQWGTYIDIPWQLPEVVGCWGTNLTDLSAFLTHARALEDAEGYVVRFGNGFMIKIKADAYVARHRARDGMSLEKNVLRLVIESGEDDVIPLLPAEEGERLRSYASAVRSGIAGAAGSLAATVGRAKDSLGEDRKRFALEVVPGLPRLLQGPAFSIWLGKDPAAVVAELVGKHCGTANDVERVRSLLGDARWIGQALEAA